MTTKNTMGGAREAAPFVKWVGGKRKLAAQLLELRPARVRRYVEPFVGGGALFFALRNAGFNEPALLRDVNEELINTYQVVRDSPTDLVRALRQHVNTEEAFYAVRAQSPEDLDAIERAARFIYLNKTCFNGLHRVNKAGRFNSPFGRYDNPTICDEAGIFAASRALYNTSLAVRSFAALADEIGDGDFVYCDPPYVPASPTANFTAYSADGFGLAQQQQLAAVAREWAVRGATVVLSNADVPLVRELYAGMEITPVQMARNINSKATARGKVGEVIATLNAPKRGRRAA